LDFFFGRFNSFSGFFDYWRWVKKYGMRDYIRDRIERKRNFYFTLFIWFLNLSAASWLAIVFLSR